MSNNKKAPAIRFKGFNEDWEQRKLEKVFTIRNEKNGDRYTRDDVLAVSDTYGCVNQIAFHGRSFAGEDISNYKVVRTGDIVYTKSPLQAKPYGIIKIVGEETGIISPLYVVNETIGGIDPMFMYYLFDTPERTNNYLSPLVRKGAKNTMNISNEEWLSGIVTISPNEEEQEKIGSFFRQLDSLITLQKRKCDKLILLKKAMLEQMFPKGKKSIPEIRFKGFNDDWERRAFKNIFDFLQNNALSRANLSDKEGDVLNIHYGDILVKFGEVIDIEKDKLPSIVDESIVKKYTSSLLQNGDVIIADAAEDETVGKCSEIKGLSGKKVLAGLHTIPVRPKEKYACTYLGYYMNSGSYHNQLLPLIQGTKVSSISKSAIQDTEILYPKSEEEQTQIGNFFRNLDNLITLHQRKLEKLKVVKKSMLDKMFI